MIMSLESSKSLSDDEYQTYSRCAASSPGALDQPTFSCVDYRRKAAIVRDTRQPQRTRDAKAPIKGIAIMYASPSRGPVIAGRGGGVLPRPHQRLIQERLLFSIGQAPSLNINLSARAPFFLIKMLCYKLIKGSSHRHFSCGHYHPFSSPYTQSAIFRLSHVINTLALSIINGCDLLSIRNQFFLTLKIWSSCKFFKNRLSGRAIFW